jgi:signal transduction histidine kinase
VGSAVSAQPGEEQRMLSADEKIRELAMIVDKQKSDQQKLSRELEEVQAEKVRQCCGSVVVHRVCVCFELTFF